MRSDVTTGPGMTSNVQILFAAALAAAMHTLDPAGILNPGVLIDSMQSS
jgi:hypothetical protein